MDAKKVVDKLEHDLAHFMIKELCKNDPEKRSKPEMYKYKGLSINVNPDSKEQEKTVSVRIGSLEAEFKIDSCEKNSGGLSPEEEHVIKLWLSQSDNNGNLRLIFNKEKKIIKPKIIPFDLEHMN